MNWFFSRRTVHSKKNGPVRITRVLGTWRLFSGGNENTGPELTEVWEEAFKVLLQRKPSTPVRNILQVGLGAGGTIKEMYRYFPDCVIDAVEYDSQMIAIANTIKLWKPFNAPNIYEKDAKEFLAHSSKTYDLILIDLFFEGKPAALLNDSAFMHLVKRATAKDGAVLINVFKNPEYLAVAPTVLGRGTVCTLDANAMGFFYPSKTA